MHVVVPIDSGRRRSVESMKFVELRLDDVIERRRKAGMKRQGSKTMSAQVLADVDLVPEEHRRRLIVGKRRREVEMKTGVHSFLAPDLGGATRVFHEHHRAG